MWSEWMARTLKLRPGAEGFELTRIAAPANPPPQPSPSRGEGVLCASSLIPSPLEGEGREGGDSALITLEL
jgi:hypothetical protein